MKVILLILSILLTILRVPFTIWYIVVGTFLKVPYVINKLAGNKIYSVEDNDAAHLATGLFSFEWASLVKFYHFKW